MGNVYPAGVAGGSVQIYINLSAMTLNYSLVRLDCPAKGGWDVGCPVVRALWPQLEMVTTTIL